MVQQVHILLRPTLLRQIKTNYLTNRLMSLSVLHRLYSNDNISKHSAHMHCRPIRLLTIMISFVLLQISPHARRTRPFAFHLPISSEVVVMRFSIMIVKWLLMIGAPATGSGSCICSRLRIHLPHPALWLPSLLPEVTPGHQPTGLFRQLKTDSDDEKSR